MTLLPLMSSFGDATTIGMLNVLGYSDFGDEVTAYAEGTGDSCNAAACVRARYSYYAGALLDLCCRCV